MSDDYTPTDRDVEVAHIENRWLAEHDRQVAEKAWDEGYKDRGGVVVDIYGDVTETRENPYRSTALQGIQEESKA